MEKIVHRVPEGAEPARIDRYLADALGMSRARVKDAIDKGRVKVDGRRVKKGDAVRPGSEIVAELSTERAPPKPQPELPLKVLHEDPAFVVVDKPAGTPTHPLEEEELGTLGNALIARYPECLEASEDARECGFAHRLDTETSGAMVAARNREAYTRLREAFSARAVGKTYVALVGGLIGSEGEIDVPIAHHPSNQRVMIACALEEDAVRLKARDALTRFKLLERVGDYALLEIEIPTGVMHQIRVHLSSIGAPVAGDAQYGGPAVEGLTRQFLHAQKLSFPHP
ncbi:MAG: RluA family pseudouridine synthase, partial [Myxococcales bacterium]